MVEESRGYRHFFCVNCGVRLRVKAGAAGKKLPCPKCAAIQTVPQPGGVQTSSRNAGEGDIYAIREEETLARPMISSQERSGPVQTRPQEADEVYTVSESPNEETSPFDADNEKDGVEPDKIPSNRPKPPPWPMVRGVFTFLWEPGAIVYLAILSTLGTICVTSVSLYLAISGNIYSIGVGINSVLLLILNIFLCLVFAFINSVCCLTILQESSAGNHVVEEWPGLAFIDYLGEFTCIVNSVLITAVAIWLITLPLADSQAARFFSVSALSILFYPVILLSMLEAQSCLLPASAAVWQSIRRSLKTWLAFYFESFAMAIGFGLYLAVIAFGVGQYSASKEVSPPLFLLILSMCVVPAVFLEMIYFRLMGRLAWVCDEDARRELVELEEEEDEQEEVREIRATPIDDF